MSNQAAVKPLPAVVSSMKDRFMSSLLPQLNRQLSVKEGTVTDSPATDIYYVFRTQFLHFLEQHWITEGQRRPFFP